MSYELKVSTGDVESKAGKVQQDAIEIQSRITELTKAMGELAGTWTGTAASAFQDMYANWDKTARQMQEALDGIGKSLDVTGQNYAELESKLAKQFK